jgi:hypothetical protein
MKGDMLYDYHKGTGKIIFKWIRLLEEQKENSNASRYSYDKARNKETC